jgi:hypothetical protein
VEVVDLAKDPNTGGPLARSTTPKLKLDKALETNGPLKTWTGLTSNHEYSCSVRD